MHFLEENCQLFRTDGVELRSLSATSFLVLFKRKGGKDVYGCYNISEVLFHRCYSSTGNIKILY